MTLLVTGGAGFIGANFVLDWLAQSDEPVVDLDKLTYAGNPDNLSSLDGDSRHQFVRGDINDRGLFDHHWLDELQADRGFGLNGREDTLQAAILLAKLEALPEE